jgi:hypothetical protein
MLASRSWWCLLPLAASCVLVGCGNGSGPAGPQEEEEIPLDAVIVTGTVTTPSGDRVSLVNVRLFGVYGDSLNPSYDALAVDTTDATGAFLVEYADCHAYPRFFLDLEIGCFPIGLREVGCGAWEFDFVWNPPGELRAPPLCSMTVQGRPGSSPALFGRSANLPASLSLQRLHGIRPGRPQGGYEPGDQRD